MPSHVHQRETADRVGDAAAADESEGQLPASELLVGPKAETEPVLSVVLPTKNEEAGLERTMDWIHEAVEELQLPTEIVVSDSSTDRTPEIARERGAIVVSPDEPGYGYAYRYAFARVRGDYVVIGDADATYDFRDVPRLYDHLRETGADIVLGSRLEGEIEAGAMPRLHRYVGNPGLTAMLNLLYDTDVSDAHSGFRIFERSVLDELELETTGMEFASEMIMAAGSEGLEVEEVPIVYRERRGEETLDSFRDGWRHVRFMLLNSPGSLFSLPGLLLASTGLVALALAVLDVGVVPAGSDLHAAVLGGLLTLLGVGVFTLGAFVSVRSDVLRRPDDALTRWVATELTLERGLALGLGLTVLGGLVATSSLLSGLAAGVEAGTLSVQSVLSVTVLCLGLQTVFGSFFLRLGRVA